MASIFQLQRTITDQLLLVAALPERTCVLRSFHVSQKDEAEALLAEVLGDIRGSR
jgi:hypothetical protein